MFNFLKKEAFKIVAPIDGELIPLSEVPDQMFSQKLMGDGFAIIPSGDEVIAPISGIAETVFPTGHAIGIKTKEGIECIIHVGIDTVELQGEGFQPLIRQGDKVKRGEPLISLDKAGIEAKGYNLSVMVVFPAGYEHVFDLGTRSVVRNEELVS